MKSILLNLVLLLLVLPAFASNFYISNNGNNNANGTSPASAWKTINRLNSAADAGQIGAGDSVLFRRGDTFFGEIKFKVDGDINNRLVLGAYGVGDKPIISGSQAITNWTKMPGSNIWYSNVSLDTVAYLLMNGAQQTLARYPNTGYLLMDGGSTKYLQCNSLKGGSNYWQGATVRMRTSRWTYEYRRVSSSNNTGRLNFQKDSRYAAAKNWGFFMDNKYEELDMPGEWFYNPNNSRVFYWPPNNQNPNNLNIQGFALDYGLVHPQGKDMDYMVVRDLIFKNQIIKGLDFKSLVTNDVTIENCEFYNQGETGVRVSGTNIVVRNNFFRGQLGRGLKGHKVIGGDFSHNVMRSIGMREGYGYDGNQNMNGFHFTRTENVYIGYNQIDSVGYTGISCYTAYSTVEKNIINYCNMRLDDGSAIYAYHTQSHHTLIQDNIIRYVVGYTVGTKNPHKPTSHGIYMDWGVISNTIRNNTIIGVATSGIFINTGNQDMTIENNVVMDYGDQGIRVMETKKSNTTINNTFDDNVCYSYKADAEPVYLISLYGTEMNMGKFKNNYFLNPYSDYSSKAGSYYTQRGYTLEEWEAVTPASTSGNKLSPFEFTGYEVSADLSPNMVENGEFDADETGWSYTTNNANSGWVFNNQLDGGALNLQMLNNNFDTASASTPLSDDLITGRFYRINFSIMSSNYGTVELILAKANNNIVEKIDMPYTPSRRDHELILHMTSDLVGGKIVFRLKKAKGNHFILDNVGVAEVEVLYDDPTQKVEIFTNEGDNPKLFNLAGNYFDLDGVAVSNSITVGPWASTLLFRGDSANSNTGLPPKAEFTIDQTTGPATLDVNVDASASSDPDGNIVAVVWNWGDGTPISYGSLQSHAYTVAGTYDLEMIVFDNSSLSDTMIQKIVVTQGSGGNPCQLSPGWISQDIGAIIGVPGEACEDQNGTVVINASGLQLDKKWDICHFLYQPISGNGWISARIVSMEAITPETMAGVMMREHLEGSAPKVFMGMGAMEQYVHQVRDVDTAYTQSTWGTEGALRFSQYVKIERVENEFYSYYSDDGQHWTLVSVETVDMPEDIFIGLAAATADNFVAGEFVIDDITVFSPNSFPVELIEFSADHLGDEVQLDWVTATELNNDFFTVERSVDGQIFEVVGHIEGYGNSDVPQAYTLNDKGAIQSKVYYRLKQTDFDGSFVYLSTIEVSFDFNRKGRIKVFPNPVTNGRVSIALTGLDLAQLEHLYLMDLTGREIASINPSSKFFDWTLPSEVPPGTYLLVAIHKEGMLSTQISVN